MKKLILLLTLQILLFNNPLIAQQKDEPIKQLSAVNAYVSLGYLQKDFETLNKYSIDNNLPVFSNRGINLGFGGNVFFNRFIYGGQGNVELSTNGDGNTSNSKINSGSAFINVGYIIQENTQSIFYPSFGVGMRGTELHVKPNTSDQGEQNISSYRITSTNILANLSLNTDFFLNSGNYKKGGLVVGLSLGYSLIPSGFIWNTSTQAESKNELPEKLGSINTSGILFKIKLGWGVK